MPSILDQCRTEPGAPNLDDQWPDDLREFVSDTMEHGRKNCPLAIAAGIMFPERDRKSALAATRILHKYASKKVRAMQFRLSDDTNSAVETENQCETLYASLPQWARW